MIEWLSANYGTIIVSVTVIGIVAALIVSRIRDKKKGRSCCGGCSGCAMSGQCHGNDKGEEAEEKFLNS